MKLRISSVAPPDAPALLQLAQAVDEAHVYPTLSTAGQELLAQHRQQDIQQLFEGERLVALKAEVKQRIVGYIAWREGHYISHLYVANDFQRQGIGTRLLDAMRRRATRLPLRLKASLNAVGFYQRYGFHPTAEIQNVGDIRFVPMSYRPWHY